MSLLLLACQCASDDVVVDSDTGCVETTWYVDGDGDDFGAEAVSSCEQPEGTVEVGGDCDDEDPQRHPAATELCDGVDRDCDGVASVEVLFVDEDGDGYGDQIVAACEPEEGLSELAGDCDDTDATIYPSATEVPYDGIDQDCDGEDLTDVDGDGASVEDDCDDNDARRHPWSIETCGDGVDNDCNDIAEDCLTFEGTPIELGAVIWGNRAQQNVSGGGAWTGYPSMERAGDIDGDGSDDLVLVGDEGDNYGFFHVVQGPFVGETWVRDGLAHAGPSADTYYAQVAGGIDLNGDLVVDWMCSDADSDTAWLISGASTGLAADLSPISEITRGYDGDLDVLDLGNQILAGELNGDASPDVLVSAWLTEDPTSTDEKWVSKTVGAAYIFFGPLSGAQTTDDAEALISGPWMSSIGAWAAAIDSDGNGTADLVLGTRNERPGGTGESGSGLYLFEGPIASGTTSAIDADHRVGDSSSEHWELARSVRDGGDLNADGYEPLGNL